jgi:predicted Zn-dependent protease
MAASLAEADEAAKSGRPDQAYAILKAAATANPTDKAPWLRMAQMRFEDKSYGEAIINGLAAIERDPDDTLAYSLVAVSGLRVSSKALGDLTQKNGFSGSVRSEAQDLANLLHTTLKQPIVSTKGTAIARPAAPKTVAPAAAAKACTGPFCGLN